MQEPLEDLIRLGGLLPESASLNRPADVFDNLARVVRALISPPIEAEARATVGLFPPDETSCFGLAWALVHFIEKAPGWPYADVLDDRNWWVTFLRERAERSGLLPPRSEPTPRTVRIGADRQRRRAGSQAGPIDEDLAGWMPPKDDRS